MIQQLIKFQKEYTVVVDDSNLCSETFSYIVLAPNPLIINGSVTDVSCHGGNSGSISTNIIGGTSPYTFQWLPDSQSTSYISSLSAGTYTVNVNDANNCYSVFGSASATFIVSEPSLPIQVTIDTTHVVCFGQSNGQHKHKLLAVLHHIHTKSTGDTTQIINNLPAGSYSVIVEDANFCQHTVFFDITQPNQLVLLQALLTQHAMGLVTDRQL